MTYLAMILLANCTLYGRVEVLSPQGQCSAVVLPHDTMPLRPNLPPLIIPDTNNGTIILIEEPMMQDFIEESEENK
jgi:hypothetical protein